MVHSIIVKKLNLFQFLLQLIQLEIYHLLIVQI